MKSLKSASQRSLSHACACPYHAQHMGLLHNPSATTSSHVVTVGPHGARVHLFSGRTSIASCNHGAQAPRRSSIKCTATRLPMSSTVIQIVSQAKAQAARQGVLFLGLDHLVLGLLATPCHTMQLMGKAGLSFEQAQEELDSKVVVPVASSLAAGDVDMSPVARQAITYAQECALAQDCRVIGSSHLGAVLLQDDRSPLRGMLEAQGVNVRALEDEVLSSSDVHPEIAAHLSSADQQMEKLQQEYRRMSATATDGPPHGAYPVQQQATLPPAHDDDDDIYN